MSRKSKNKIEDVEEASEELFDTSNMRIIAPSGKPPFQLESTDPDDVTEWALKIAKSGPYTMNAIIYWVRYFHEIWSPEHKAIAAFLKEKSESLGIPYVK
jgi:hypothetical protein